MNLNRRTLFKLAAAAGTAGVAGAAATSRASVVPAAKGARGVLVDTTRCVGCRACEAACAEANVLAGPEKPGDDTVFASKRATSPTAYTVVQKGSAKSPAGEDRFAKAQCMHCVDAGLRVRLRRQGAREDARPGRSSTTRTAASAAATA